MKALTLSLLVASLLVLPGVADSHGPYDGRWSIHAKADRGNCDDDYGVNIEVINGRVKYHGLLALIGTGSVNVSGVIVMRVGEAHVQGQLAATNGGGRWASPKCHGAWTAARV